MKVVLSIRERYLELKELAILLQRQIDDLMYVSCNRNEWFYRSRVKTEESFSLKWEVSPFYQINDIDDFFGCEIVVNNLNEIEKVKAILGQLNISISHQRPENPNLTFSQPSDFNFTELRLYCRKLSVENEPHSPLHDLLFEVQVKTIFSFAWSKATHDLIYKVDRVSWSKSRIAYQIKASLEQAEYQVSTISSMETAFFPESEHFKSINEIIDIINRNWDPSFLPKDMKRLAENVLKFLILIDVSNEDFEKVVIEAKDKYSNLSPYLKVIQVIHDKDMSIFFNIRKPHNKYELLIPYTPELDIEPKVLKHLESVKRLKVLPAR